jgi:hypothetical protein
VLRRWWLLLSLLQVPLDIAIDSIFLKAQVAQDFLALVFLGKQNRKKIPLTSILIREQQ